MRKTEKDEISAYTSKCISQGYQMQTGNKKDERLINVKSEIFFAFIINRQKRMDKV